MSNLDLNGFTDTTPERVNDMSEWFEIKESDDVDLSDDKKFVHILFETDRNGNRYVEVPVEFFGILPELSALRARVAELEERNKWWLENYDITMPCGHKNRYLSVLPDGKLERDADGDTICLACYEADDR